MKKLLSFLLVLCLCASAMVMLSACDEGDAKGNFEELNEEEWEAALSAPNFENVTVKYEYTQEGAFMKQVMKTTKTGVYRSIEVYASEDAETPMNKDDVYFDGENAKTQRNLFLQTFLGIVADKDNFEFDEEAKLYKADDVEVRIDQAPGVYVLENVKNGKLKFGEEGNVEEFICTLTESVYYDGELKQSVTIDVTWHFSDYGTTKITEEEQKATSTAFG